MDNPFLKRATEFLQDDEAFLSVIAPEPIEYYLGRLAKEGLLYDRLVIIRGTPGSGKTTLARIFEYKTLFSLIKNVVSFKDLYTALSACQAVVDDRPAFLGFRLALETDYRDFWEFPYDENLKSGLMATFIQARVVLGWMRHLASAGIDSSAVEMIPKAGAESLVSNIGGLTGELLAKRARGVESALYSVMNALIAPKVRELRSDIISAYRPFDIVDRFRIKTADGVRELRPLVILDDANLLHPEQFRALERWLARRELRISRWVISRFDVLRPQEVFDSVTEDGHEKIEHPGLKVDRDKVILLLQSTGPRREQRLAFRRMAKDMGNRYLRRMPLLTTRNLLNLGDLLSNAEQQISNSKLQQLESEVTRIQHRLTITDNRKKQLEHEIASYRTTSGALPRDIQLAMLAILMHRYNKRRGGIANMFETEEDPDPSRPVTANASVLESAKLHLLHEFERPYYFGIDDLCDAAGENAEQFLQLAATLVEMVVTHVIRGKAPTLDAPLQHKLLRQRGADMLDQWDFPNHHKVRTLVASIAQKCLVETRTPNGWLTPNAYGILQTEFDDITKRNPEAARVLQFALAYNAITIIPKYPCKMQEWCLFELGGMVLLKYGLTFNRGGFVEGTLRGLITMLEESS